MKKLISVLLILCLLVSLSACGSKNSGDDSTVLDVVICKYGPNTEDWFTGSGMNGSSFKKEFEKAYPEVKLNIQIVSWNDVNDVVDKMIAEGKTPIYLIPMFFRTMRLKDF